MTERYADAALRHLGTAEVLENEERWDDAAYHYGLVGEMSLKAAVIAAISYLPQEMWSHINQARRRQQDTLQNEISRSRPLLALLTDGRLGGALGSELTQGLLRNRFQGWSINIRYHDDRCCPVSSANLQRWKADATALYNNGVF